MDDPVVQGEATITLRGRDVSVSSRVEQVDGDLIVVRPSAGEYLDQEVVVVGDAVDISWVAPGTVWALPADVATVTGGAVVRWHLRRTGATESAQRREAVRARVAVPVRVRHGSIDLTGETGDLSETGAKVVLAGVGAPPDAGAVLEVCLDLDGGPVTAKAELLRLGVRGARWSASLRFTGLGERDQDRLRARVFRAMREERARLAD